MNDGESDTKNNVGNKTGRSEKCKDENVIKVMIGIREIMTNWKPP